MQTLLFGENFDDDTNEFVAKNIRDALSMLNNNDFSEIILGRISDTTLIDFLSIIEEKCFLEFGYFPPKISTAGIINKHISDKISFISLKRGNLK